MERDDMTEMASAFKRVLRYNYGHVPDAGMIAIIETDRGVQLYDVKGLAWLTTQARKHDIEGISVIEEAYRHVDNFNRELKIKVSGHSR